MEAWLYTFVSSAAGASTGASAGASAGTSAGASSAIFPARRWTNGRNFFRVMKKKKPINHPSRPYQEQVRAAAAHNERGAAGAEGGAHRRVGVRSPLLREYGAGDDGAAWGPPPSLKRAGCSRGWAGGA